MIVTSPNFFCWGIWGRPDGSALWHIVVIRSEPTWAMEMWPAAICPGTYNPLNIFAIWFLMVVIRSEPTNENRLKTHLGQCMAVTRPEPACAAARVNAPGIVNMDPKSKRKAASPCESQNKNSRFVSPNSSFEPEFFSPISDFEVSSNQSTMAGDDSMDQGEIFSVSYTVENKDGESFRGALDRPMAKMLWEKGLNLPGTLLYGIALNQSTDRSFLIDYELKESIEWSECPVKYEVELNGSKFNGQKFVPKPKPAELGEEVLIRIKKTRFKIKPDQATRWIENFGKITVKADFENAPDLPTLKSDDIIMKAILRKHIPGILPAYGRKMIVIYSGQPILCGKCFSVGHIRSKCPKEESIKWATFEQVVSEEKFVSKEMLGDWTELLKKDN